MSRLAVVPRVPKGTSLSHAPGVPAVVAMLLASPRLVSRKVARQRLADDRLDQRQQFRVAKG